MYFFLITERNPYVSWASFFSNTSSNTVIFKHNNTVLYSRQQHSIGIFVIVNFFLMLMQNTLCFYHYVVELIDFFKTFFFIKICNVFSGLGAQIGSSRRKFCPLILPLDPPIYGTLKKE